MRQCAHGRRDAEPTDAERVDVVFGALGNPARRAALGRLARGGASVTELARPFDVVLPTFIRQLALLEGSGFVRAHKADRIQTRELAPSALAVGRRRARPNATRPLAVR